MENQLNTFNFTFNYLPNEFFATLSVVMYTQKNFVLAQAINDVIQKLQSAGLVEYWHYTYFKKSQRKHEDENRLKLSLNHLKGAFEILAIGFISSLVAFIFEKMSYKLFNKK